MRERRAEGVAKAGPVRGVRSVQCVCVRARALPHGEDGGADEARAHASLAHRVVHRQHRDVAARPPAALHVLPAHNDADDLLAARRLARGSALGGAGRERHKAELRPLPKRAGRPVSARGFRVAAAAAAMSAAAMTGDSGGHRRRCGLADAAPRLVDKVAVRKDGVGLGEVDRDEVDDALRATGAATVSVLGVACLLYTSPSPRD